MIARHPHVFGNAQYKTTDEVLVDWEEQNRMVNGLLFFLRTDAKPKISLWESNKESDTVIAEHDGYARLSGEVIHQRTLHLDKRNELLLICDKLRGSETHDIQCLFQFVNLQIEALNPAQILFHPDDDDSVLFMDLSEDPHLFVDTNWVSPSYGMKEPGIRICSGGKFNLPVTKYFAMIPVRDRDVNSASALARERLKELRW